jgi:hypothetical protein
MIVQTVQSLGILEEEQYNLTLLHATPSVLKYKIFWFVLSQTVLSLIKFIRQSNNILNIKLEHLDPL